MDPIELIKEDHRRVEALFDEYEACGEEAYDERAQLVATIIDELEAHMEMEESIVYPAFQQAFAEEEDRKVEEGFAEHDVAKNLIEELKALLAQDPQWEAKVQVLKENIMHHVEEEEGDILPAAEESLSGDDMARIGEEMQAFKDAREDEALDALTSSDDDLL